MIFKIILSQVGARSRGRQEGGRRNDERGAAGAGEAQVYIYDGEGEVEGAGEAQNNRIFCSEVMERVLDFSHRAFPDGQDSISNIFVSICNSEVVLLHFQLRTLGL